MSTQEYIRSITESIPDDFPTLTPLTEGPLVSSTVTSSSSFLDYFSSITWQTWVIIVLILALLGINIFAYLAKGTQAFDQIFSPILKLFGYTTLETTKEVVQTSATGAEAGIQTVAGVTTGAINTVEQVSQNRTPVPTSGTYMGISTANAPQGQAATSSLPVQNMIQESGANMEQWQQDSLEKALSNASQSVSEPQPDNSKSSIQTTGKPGWCYIGEDEGIRTCSEIGVNDVCMSGDVFPNQAICMNPNLRA